MSTVSPVAAPSDAASSAINESAANAAVHKAALRLLPFLFFLYIIAYLDRVNVGFAKLQMNSLPWFSETVFGTGAGIFFLGYFLFEVPSNLILHRVGARRWIARIMFSWGLVAMAMLAVHDVKSFYFLRFLLGIAEAGFFPGILLYFTYWFTAKERARIVAMFMTANSVAFIFGGPLSGWLMGPPPLLNLPIAGWQQMFLLEGLPAVLLGFVVLRFLPDGPARTSWLSAEEQRLILERVQRDKGLRISHAGDAPVVHPKLSQTLSQPTVLVLCLTFFFLVSGMYGISMWLPQIISSLGKRTPLEVGLLTAIPYTAAGLAMVANGFHSDRTGERPWHIAVPAAVGTIGLVGCALSAGNPFASLGFLSIAAAGMWSTLGPFWSLPPLVLRGRGDTALAGGIAFVNSVGNLGGFLGPFAVGKIKDATQGFLAPLCALAACVLLGGLMALVAGAMAPKDTNKAS